MADEKQSNGEGKPEGEGAPLDFESADLDTPTGGKKPETDSGFGNLPPLSDFESSDGGAGFDSSLPPLGDLSSDGGIDTPEGTGGGLPPISDLEVETPIPTGGNVKPPPPGFEDTPQLETPVAESGLDTPQEPAAPGTSFQDLAADSDFTPETPEVAPPGPETDLETPMFDSAFGGDTSGFGAADTSAPTQAMETPMFGAEPSAQPQQQGFDEDAFGGGFAPQQQQANGGTPLPDFSPDTAVSPAPTGGGLEPPSMATPGPRKAAKGGGGGGLVLAAAMLIVGLVVGLLFGPMIGDKVPNPLNPYPEQIAQLEKESQSWQDKYNVEVNRKVPEGVDGTAQTKEDLLAQKDALSKEIAALTTKKETADTEYETVSKKLDQANSDVQAATEKFAQKKDEYDQVMNQYEVVQAREDGLHAEVARLQQQVGKLEVANSRSIVTRETLQNNIEELGIMVREGNPLTPQEYGRDKRIAAVDALRQKAAGIPWVAPELLDEYTALYLRELEIAATQKYFFAKIPVKDRFGVRKMSWAECLMNGNWNTYFRTLDGEHIGIYKNVNTGGAPQYTFVEEPLDEMTKAKVEQEIFTSRTPGFESQVKLLAQRELALDDKDSMQKVYDSL